MHLDTLRLGNIVVKVLSADGCVPVERRPSADPVAAPSKISVLALARRIGPSKSFVRR